MKKTNSILIVDDNRDNLTLMGFVLKSLNREIILAANGKEAIELIEKHDFDLILLDIQMPEMDGFETAKIIRLNAKYKFTPIVFISAQYDNLSVKKGYNEGVLDYFFKPVDVAITRAKVSILLELKNNENFIDQTTNLIIDHVEKHEKAPFIFIYNKKKNYVEFINHQFNNLLNCKWSSIYKKEFTEAFNLNENSKLDLDTQKNYSLKTIIEQESSSNKIINWNITPIGNYLISLGLLV